MARTARVEVFAADEVAIVHVMNRTVRRCFLLGDDPVTGENYDHRKQWIDEQLIHQAKHFGIDLLCQAILSNHFHLVLRSRPDVVAEWSDEEVARRWLMLCPVRRDEKRRPLPPSEPELNSIVNDKDRLASIRSRLSDISWWMRLLSQNIAQRANKDDGEVGKFWQARYRGVRLIDETAILACAAYVDLNPIRAAIAETIEGSDYTSGQKRAAELARRRGNAESGQRQGGEEQSGRGLAPCRSNGVSGKGPCGGANAGSGGQCPPCEDSGGRSAQRTLLSARHLAPVELRERTKDPGPDLNKRGTRCSNKGFLPMSTADYLTLLDWTARRIRPGKRGSTPKELAPIFRRLGISEKTWIEMIQNFGRLFSVVAGLPKRVDEFRSKGRQARFHLRKSARELLG
ncbi:MAG: transposase [Planctomycetaceae bacterium]